MHEPLITVVGHLAGPPRQRLLPNGHAVADFRIASTPRKQDKESGAWGDGETIWFGVTAWRTLAEHCATSLKKGDKVVVTGRLSSRSWDVEGGERRSSLEVDASSVGLDLSRGNVAYVRPGKLVVDEDPWISSGQVDPDTGEVLAERAAPDGERSDGEREVIGVAA